MAYMLTDGSQGKSELEIKHGSSGVNFILLAPNNDRVFYGSMQIVWPVSVYLDLSGYRGRGEEASDSLMGNAINRT
jgi:hypothetical protein